MADARFRPLANSARTTSSFIERAAGTVLAFGSSVRATLFLPTKWPAHESNYRIQLEQSSRSYARFLDHKNSSNDVGRDRRRYRNHDAQLGVLGWNATVSCCARCSGCLSNCCEEVSSLSLLGHDHSLHDVWNHDGRFCGSVFGNWLYGRFVDFVTLPLGNTRPLVLVAWLDIGRHR